MPHDTPLITTIVAALVLAFIFGAIANRLKMPPIVGYLIAGICVGPHSPGFVADQTLASQLADLGVVLLMFGVGLNFSMGELLSVKAVAIPGALIRLVLATAMGVALGLALGWPIMGGLVFGLALAVSSTVVTLKVLQDRHLVDSDRGRIAVGWLVVEDLAMVLALVLIPAFSGSSSGGAGAEPSDAFLALAEQLLHTHLVLWQVILITLIKLLAFAGFMIVVGRRIIPAILHATAHTGSRELFRLAVLAIALGVAAGAAYLFGVSLALGAFFAGMILSESQLSQRAAQETLPLRDAFGVLFFVSVGMLFDPGILLRDPLPVLATVVIVVFGKSILAFLLMLLFRRPVGAALTVSASLAQIGEFSFILAALGISLGLMPEEGRGLILAGAIISIFLNPLVFWASEKLRPRLEARVTPSARMAERAEPELGPVVPGRTADLSAAAAPPPGNEVLEEESQRTRLNGHVVLIGYGRVGTVVGGELVRQHVPFVVVEDAEGRVLAAREAEIEVIVGNAALRETLSLANVMGARCVIIAIPNAFEAGQATEQCRKLNAGVKIIARAHSDEEESYLEKLGADKVIMGEREIGLGMIDWLGGGERGEAAPADGEAGGLLGEIRAVRPVPGELVVAATMAAVVPEIVAPMPPAVEVADDEPSVTAAALEEARDGDIAAVEETGRATPRMVAEADIMILPPAGSAVTVEQANRPVAADRSAMPDVTLASDASAEPPLSGADANEQAAEANDSNPDAGWLSELEADLFGDKEEAAEMPPVEAMSPDPAPAPPPAEVPLNPTPTPAPQPAEVPPRPEPPSTQPEPAEVPVPPNEVPPEPGPGPIETPPAADADRPRPVVLGGRIEPTLEPVGGRRPSDDTDD